MSMEILVWCGANMYGHNCAVECHEQGHKKCDPKTGLAICDQGNN